MMTRYKSKAREDSMMEGKFDPIIINIGDRVESLDHLFELLENHAFGKLKTSQIKVQEVINDQASLGTMFDW